MRPLLKFCSLPRREKQFLCEATILLLLANLCVRMIAFRHIDGFLRSHWNDGTQGATNHACDIELVKLSLSRAANLLPWQSLCLSRSIAAYIMLRRRDIPAVMFAGVKSREDLSLLAHAWVQTAGGVIDGNPEAVFTPLLRIGQEPVDR
jgi:Transglutaminase-like superfamily